MGNTLEAFKQTHPDDNPDHVHQPVLEDDDEEVEIDPAELIKYLRPDEVYDKPTSKKLDYSTDDLRRYVSSILAPLASDSSIEEPSKCVRILLKIWAPFWFVLKPFWCVIVFINDLAGNPVGEDSNLQNGCIFVSTVGILQHSILLACARNPEEMGIIFQMSRATTLFELAMLFSNIGNMIAAYSNIWQTCIPAILLSPLYMGYLGYSVVHRLLYPGRNSYYDLIRNSEQGCRLFWMMYEFSVLMGYGRKVRSERAARDGYIRAKRRRLKLLGRTRRQEDRREFLRDPARQTTVLLLADDRKPWLRQTMAAKLAERALADNQAIAALYAPSALLPVWDEETNQVVLRKVHHHKHRHHHHKAKVSNAPPPSPEEEHHVDTKRGGFFSWLFGFGKKT